jgi:hypothetical protein
MTPEFLIRSFVVTLTLLFVIAVVRILVADSKTS